MPSYSSSSIRLALSVASAPGAGLQDDETGESIAIFPTSGLAINFAVFDQFDDIVDLSNITYVEADFIDDPEVGNILAQATIPGSALASGVNILGWRNGTQAQGTLTFSAAQLDGLAEGKVWLIIRALTQTGFVVPWGAGWVEVDASGVSPTINMPLSPIPSLIPFGANYLVPSGVGVTFPASLEILGSLNLAAGATVSFASGTTGGSGFSSGFSSGFH